MFEVLLESGARRPGGLAPRAMSLSVHGIALVAAGLGWRQAEVEMVGKPMPVAIDIYEAPASPDRGRPSVGDVTPVVGGLILMPSIPDVVPMTIPSTTAEFPGSVPGPDPRTLVERELWGNGPRQPAAPPDSILLAGEVDEAVIVLLAARPVYPAVLAASGVAGEVRLEFVVDASGRCEPHSVRVISSTIAAFEAPAIDAIVATAYRAGRVRGQAVRQLVQQRVAFRVQ